jgi:hypothetical protein
MTDRPTGDDRPAEVLADRPGPPGHDRPTGTDRSELTAPDHPRPADASRLVTLAEAAAITGTTTEAIRSRIRRRTLRAAKGNHGVWMVHRDELETGRPTATTHGHPASNPVKPGQQPETARPTGEETALRDRLEALTAELTAERLDRAAERLEVAERHGRELGGLRERIGRIEAEGMAAQEARRVAEAAQARAESQVEALTAELREVRRPLWERVVRSLRG